MRKRLLIFNDGWLPEVVEDLPHSNIDLEFVPEGTREQLIKGIRNADAYMCSLRIRVDAEILDACERLRLVATNSTGTDHLDLALLEARQIEVISIKEERELLRNLTSTAELAFALMLTCVRHLPECFSASRDGRWERQRLAGRELKGKTVGIIGLGRLGSMMAEYARAFRMTIIAHDPAPSCPQPEVRLVGLDDLLRESDIITLHVHLNERTRMMIGPREMALMKPGVCLINTSRGGLIDEAALIREMESGRIVAAGLDVIDGEWNEDKYNHQLIAYSRRNPHLYITPHVGGTSREAVRQTVRHVFGKAVKFLECRP